MSRVRIILFAIVTTIILFLCGYVMSTIYSYDFGNPIINSLRMLYTPVFCPFGIILGAILCLLGKKFSKLGIWVVVFNSAVFICVAIILIIHGQETYEGRDHWGNLGALIWAIVAFLITFFWGKSILNHLKVKEKVKENVKENKMIIGLGLFNILWPLLVYVLIAGGGPPSGPPWAGLGILLLVIFYMTLGINIFFRRAKLIKIILICCVFLTVLSLITVAFWPQQEQQSGGWDIFYAAIFIIPLAVNLISFSRHKVKEQFK